LVLFFSDEVAFKIAFGKESNCKLFDAESGTELSATFTPKSNSIVRAWPTAVGFGLVPKPASVQPTNDDVVLADPLADEELVCRSSLLTVYCTSAELLGLVTSGAGLQVPLTGPLAERLVKIAQERSAVITKKIVSAISAAS